MQEATQEPGWMRSLGGGVFALGAISLILNLIGYDLVILMPLDLLGLQTGWAIRIGMVIGGAVLWFMGVARGEAEYQGE